MENCDRLTFYLCNHCHSTQIETEFGECAECGYENLVKISREEFEQHNA